jgi:3-hydroxymyristoyl/3-hydroxydecanoyl-(acyl carrier protein) dehydratase
LTGPGPSADKERMIAQRQVFKGIRKAGEGVALWQVPADLPYFDGHFPGNPIFPAVGIVDATLFALQLLMNRAEVFVSHFPVAKFLSPIQPGQTVRIELKALNESEWQAEWKDESGLKLLASLRFRL